MRMYEWKSCNSVWILCQITWSKCLQFQRWFYRLYSRLLCAIFALELSIFFLNIQFQPEIKQSNKCRDLRDILESNNKCEFMNKRVETVFGFNDQLHQNVSNFKDSFTDFIPFLHWNWAFEKENSISDRD